jgi:kynureninase
VMSTAATAAALSEVHARKRDAADPLAGYRERFLLPLAADGRPKTYLAGQSLGAQPAAARAEVEAELDVWARLGVDGWFARERGWIVADDAIRESTATLVGARPGEVATLNTLTVNLHLLFATFFRPAGARTAILIDAPTFPSDRYAVESQLRLHGLDPARDLVVVRPRDGEALLRTEDLEAAIHEQRDRLAVALLAGVNYATGQLHDIARLTGAVQEAGGVALWDLAHSAGNVPLALHDAGVDGAAWCTYKYLNGGPGSIAQLFVHERHATDASTLRLTGWWGNDPATRFRMAETFEPAAGADGWRISTPPILSLAPIRASLALFDEVGMDALRARSAELTGYFEALIDALVPDAEILTPRDPAARGAQLSLRVSDAPGRLAAMEAADVVGDFREPDIIRLAPVPLYNTFHDAWRAARVLADTAP